MSKQDRLRKLQSKSKPGDALKIEFTCSGVTPEPVYTPGERVIHWSQDDEFIVEIVGEDGRSHFHERQAEQA